MCRWLLPSLLPVCVLALPCLACSLPCQCVCSSLLPVCVLLTPWPAPCSPLPPTDCVLLPRQSRRSAAGAVTAAAPRGQRVKTTSSCRRSSIRGGQVQPLSMFSCSTEIHYFPFYFSFSLFAPDSLVKTEDWNLVKVKESTNTNTLT